MKNKNAAGFDHMINEYINKHNSYLFYFTRKMANRYYYSYIQEQRYDWPFISK